MEDIQEAISQLKHKRNAVILAHYYQNPEVQDIADFVGDSLELARKAMEAKESVIVLCGVRFMAENAKLLNPNKTVLLPAWDAGCPMAEMATREKVNALKKQYPDAPVVCYVNTSVEVKAASDICCTSSNAVNIIRSLPDRRILFIPDENLGSFVASQLPDKEIIRFKGFCITHKRVLLQDLMQAKKAMPDALVLVHPECTSDIAANADFCGSTLQIINFAAQSKHESFIIGTEQGVLHRLKQQNPHKRFYLLSPKLICANMKKTRLMDILTCLKNNSNEITIHKDVQNLALKSIHKMMQLS